MTFAVLLLIILLSITLTVVTFVQMLYLESLRLRTRDLPSLQLFKSKIEERFGMKTDAGALTFSLVKHGMLLLLGIAILTFAAGSSAVTWFVFIEAVLTSWLVMVGVAYVIPRVLYRRTAGSWLLPVIPVLKILALAVKPLVALLNFSHTLIGLADEKASTEEPPTSAENIEALISAGTEEGLIEEEDRKLIQSVVEFGDKVVREVMTPRPDIVAVEADATLERLRQLVIHERYSRIPVYESSIDQIVGFMHVRDIFELEEEERASRKIREVMRSIRFVPETKPVNDLMREMQQEGGHMVIVVDEYGNTAGLATMEDLVEVILGEIRDEHEPDSDVKEEADGSFLVSGSFDIGRLDDLLEFRPEDDIESTTVGGLVTEWMGRVPLPGEVIERHGIRIEVVASDELRVEQVRMRKSAVAVNG